MLKEFFLINSDVDESMSLKKFQRILIELGLLEEIATVKKMLDYDRKLSNLDLDLVIA